jgi:hypothetical protein
MVRLLDVIYASYSLFANGSHLLLTVNFSAVLRAVKHPDIAEVEEKVQRISTSVTLRDGPPLANGIWLPMDVAETEAERVNIVPNDLRDLSLRAGLRCQVSDLGFILDSSRSDGRSYRLISHKARPCAIRM